VTYPFASLPANLAAFCAVLRRDHRFRIGPRELQDAARALEIVDLADERVVRNGLRPILAARFDDLRVFDEAFGRFFRGRPGLPPADESPAPAGKPSREPRPAPPADRAGSAGPGSDAPGQETLEEGGGAGAVREVADADGEPAAGRLRATYSPLEADGAVPDLEPASRDWRDAAAALVNRVHAGRSRRWRLAARGPRFDFRRTLRGSLHTGGDVLLPRWQARPRRRPRFVLLVDGSRSMGGHARPALQMAVALAAVTLDIETFAFSTALRRVTRDVRRAAAGERRRLHLHHAWGGGTTIGACLDEFLHRFGERLLSRDTVVVIASDGLDVGDRAVLRESMARLSRHAAAIVWLNPLLDTPGYEPTALGMRVARPYVTTFASVSDAAGLARLARMIRIR
jgi:uncharacterized protein with von Willebrand factor type A (vWA) domain